MSSDFSLPSDSWSIFSRLDPVRSPEDLEFHLTCLKSLKSEPSFHQIPLLNGKLLKVSWKRIFVMGFPPVKSVFRLRCVEMSDWDAENGWDRGPAEFSFETEHLSEIIQKVQELVDLSFVQEVVEE